MLQENFFPVSGKCEGFCGVRKAQWMILIFFYRRKYSPKDKMFSYWLSWLVYLLQICQQTPVPHSFQTPHPIPSLTYSLQWLLQPEMENPTCSFPSVIHLASQFIHWRCLLCIHLLLLCVKTKTKVLWLPVNYTCVAEQLGLEIISELVNSQAATNLGR